jgi:hypothetical protein
MVAALGLAAISLAGCLMDYFSWPFGGVVLAASLGAAFWFRQRGTAGQGSGAAAAEPRIESGLRIVEKALPGKPRLPHGLRVTISTEVAINLGLRVACDGNVHEVEALVQIGRGTSARQGVPAAAREGRRAYLFVVRNSPVQRELFLRVDLYGVQPLHLEAVEVIRPGGAVVLPEWRDLEQGPGAAAGETAAGASAPVAPPDPAPAPSQEIPPDTGAGNPVP